MKKHKIAVILRRNRQGSGARRHSSARGRGDEVRHRAPGGGAFPWSCEWYQKHGPDDAGGRPGADPELRRHLPRAVGFPGVPDHVSLWGLLIPIAGGSTVRQHPPGAR